jgi:integrase/recombinase XerD
MSDLSHPSAAVQLQSADQEVIRLWLHGKSLLTQRAYLRDIERFTNFTGKPLNETTLGDLQKFADSLSSLAETSQARILAAVKSLFRFASITMPIFYPVNAAAALKLPTPKDTLAERILPERLIHRMIAMETHPRNRLILILLYTTGIRRAELCGLRWRDLQEREIDGSLTGQIVVLGKRRKTRSIVLRQDVWEEVPSLRGEAEDDEPIFVSRQRGPDGTKALKPAQVHNIVRQAARRADIKKSVSPHWFRHAHASHALNRGAPISLVQATLGHSNLAITGRYTHAQPEASSAQYLAL